MRLLISGSQGYLGSRLVEMAQEAGHTIVRVDYGAEHEWMWHRTEILGCDALIHLAALTDLYQCEQEPIKSWQVNYWGAVLAGKFCAMAETPMVFASTDTVVGLAGYPISVYDSHKLAAEKCLLSMPRLKAVTLRFSTIYGPSPTQSKKSRGVINKWIRASLAGQPVTVYKGVAEKYRDYLFIDDAINAMLAAIHVPSGHYYIGTARATQIRDMAKAIDAERVTLVDDPDGLHPIEYRTMVNNDVGFRDLSNWRATVDITEGIARTRAAFS